MLRLAAAAFSLAAAAAQAGQAVCDAGSKCSFTTTYKGKTVSFDLRGLCNAGADYVLNDGLGHTYYAQVCGTAGKSCLPQGWENEYEYGRVVQTWGSPPTCDNTCVEERTNAPACCSEPCQVIAVRDPLFSTVVAGDPSQGISLTYYGETPTPSDPYSCDYNPSTGQPYPRVTHMQFFCDPSATGFARFYEVDQNATDDCDYTLKFKTSAACIPGLSGGWIFIIVLASGFAAYALFGTLITYWREKIWAFPNRHFWAEFESLVFDGVRFIGAGFRKPAPRAKGFGSMAAADGGDAAPLATAGNPFGGGASSGGSIGVGSGGGGGGGGSSYQTIGGADGGAAAPRGSAYTDL